MRKKKSTKLYWRRELRKDNFPKRALVARCSCSNRLGSKGGICKSCKGAIPSDREEGVATGDE